MLNNHVCLLNNQILQYYGTRTLSVNILIVESCSWSSLWRHCMLLTIAVKRIHPHLLPSVVYFVGWVSYAQLYCSAKNCMSDHQALNDLSSVTTAWHLSDQCKKIIISTGLYPCEFPMILLCSLIAAYQAPGF